MTPPDAKATMALIARLWPKADWPAEVQTETARRIAALPLDAAQAEAALVNLRLRLKYATVQPVEVLEALKGATPRPQLSDADGRPTPEELATIDRLMQNRATFERLASQWLDSQGPKFAHWETHWLVSTRDSAKWWWGRRFVAWASGMLGEGP